MSDGEMSDGYDLPPWAPEHMEEARQDATLRQLDPEYDLLKSRYTHGGRPMHWNRKGEPIGLFEMARLFEDGTYQVVQQDEVGLALVSTVWLGQESPGAMMAALQHPDLPPMGIFETMVFGGELDMQQWRWDTEEQAVEGHATVLKAVRATTTKEMTEWTT